MHRTLVVGILASATAVAQAQPPTTPTLDGPPLDVVTFSTGSSRVTPEARDRIDEVAGWHAEHRDSLLFIEGHASSVGSWNKNLLLSQQRTDAVRNALVRAGADPARMVLVAHSENEADAAEGSNRRVVLRGTGAFPELAREQRDPETTEDARAEGRTMDQADDDDEDDQANRGAATSGGTTVVIVPGGGAAPGVGTSATTADRAASGTLVLGGAFGPGLAAGGASGTSGIVAGGATDTGIAPGRENTGTAAGTGAIGGAQGPAGVTGGPVSGR